MATEKQPKRPEYAPKHPPIKAEIGTPGNSRQTVNLPKDVDGKIRKKP